MINLNHINLTLTDVPSAKKFFETYLGFAAVDSKPNDALSVLTGKNGFVLVLMHERLNKNGNMGYPDNFHIGFYLNDEGEVNAMFERFKADGLSVEQHPQIMRKTYGFYFQMQNILIEITTEMGSMKKQQNKPIGWFLKEADAAITALMNSSLSAQRLTRFHWQALKHSHDNGALKVDDFAEIIRKFLNKAEIMQVITDLVNRGWFQAENDVYQLTADGKAAFTHIEALQFSNREKITAGITSEEYQMAIKVMDTIISNCQ